MGNKEGKHEKMRREEELMYNLKKREPIKETTNRTKKWKNKRKESEIETCVGSKVQRRKEQKENVQ